ncbi:MAG: hypothetical protein K0R54_3114 [Clostridiaceae bacterium]|jgi:hypothetical protein|nr:hypothetical protein [Clostridiaceae bacterium]
MVSISEDTFLVEFSEPVTGLSGYNFIVKRGLYQFFSQSDITGIGVKPYDNTGTKYVEIRTAPLLF